MCDEADSVAGDLAVLVLLTSVDEAGSEVLGVRRHLAAIDGWKTLYSF